MRTYLLLATAISLSVCATLTHAQDHEAEKIIDQYVKAQGGTKALAKARTITLEGTFTTPTDNKPGTYTFDTRLPNRYYSELVTSDRTEVEAYNGKSAWHQTSAGEIATLVGTEGTQLEAAALYYNSHLANAKKNKLGVAFKSHAQVRGRDALQLEVTSPSGLKREVLFDPQSHLVVEEFAQIAGIDQQIFYDDYRPADGGLKLPHKIELHRGPDVYDITVTRAAVNAPVGERVFDFPKKSQVQLPDLKALFKEIDDNQKAVDKLKENYAGTRNEEETEYDKAGNVTKRDLKEFSFFYLDGHEVSTLTKKDDKPLAAEEQKKENEKTQKEIADIQKNAAKKEAKEEKAKEKDKEDEDDDVGIEVFLRACQFVNPRRERFRGQDVLVFDFEPNPDFKPRKITEKVVHQLAGVIWIDEKAHDVARLQAYFVGDFKFAGGVVANLQKGTSFAFEQEYVNNEVWLPTYEEAHVGVRIFLVKGFKVNEVTRYSDYKRFNVESVASIGKSKGAAEAQPPVPDPPQAQPKPQ
jgi:hypothetical protein